MLSERFLTRLHDAFPAFYDRVSSEALDDASRLLKEADGDRDQALARARLGGAGRLWWPYVKGSIPLVGNDRPAMEAFTRIVLTVDHIVGQVPPEMDVARRHVTDVLRKSLDVERLQNLGKGDGAASAAAAGGAMASLAAIWSPITAIRKGRKWLRFVPAPLRIGVATVVLATLASIPLLAGYSTGIQAERAAERLKGTRTGASGEIDVTTGKA